MRITACRLLGVFVTFIFVSSAQAALIDRGEGFIYDDVLEITWTQNANINGLMDWDTAVAWVAGYSQTHTVYGAFDDWRLPTTTQPDPSCSVQFDPGGGFPLQGVQVDCTGSEMGHLFNVDGISSSSSGPFTNFLTPFNYWSGTEYAPKPTTDAWHFGMGSGLQNHNVKTFSLYAWAVRDGDIAAAVPIPAAAWLFGSGLLGLIGLARRKKVA